MNIEKAFDSLDHNFLISALEKYGFRKSFISWAKTLLKNQETFVLNGGATAKYFPLGRGALQGDPTLALFIYSSFRVLTLSFKIKTWHSLTITTLLCIY